MSFLRYYRRDGTPYPAGDRGLFEWAKDFENMELRIVRQDHLPNGYWVSTVWLGIDHNYHPSGPPIIFETMVVNPIGEWEDEQERYTTEDDAIIGHMHFVGQIQRRTTCLNARSTELKWSASARLAGAR